MSYIRDLLATKQAFAVFVVAFLITQTWILLTLGESGHKVGFLQTVCLMHPSPRATGQVARQFIQDEWTSQDIANFQEHFLLDTWIHPLVYALALSSAALYDLKRRNHPQRVLYSRIVMMIIFAGAGCDVVENIYHRSIQFEPELVASDELLFNACIFSCTKWFLMAVILLTLVYRYFVMAAPVEAAATTTTTEKIATKKKK